MEGDALSRGVESRWSRRGETSERGQTPHDPPDCPDVARDTTHPPSPSAPDSSDQSWKTRSPLHQSSHSSHLHIVFSPGGQAIRRRVLFCKTPPPQTKNDFAWRRRRAATVPFNHITSHYITLHYDTARYDVHELFHGMGNMDWCGAFFLAWKKESL